MEDLFQKLKRKSRKSSSTSSEEDNRPSEDKRSKVDLSEEDCGIDEVHSVLEMAEDVLPKLDIVLKKTEGDGNKTRQPWKLCQKRGRISKCVNYEGGNFGDNNKKCDEVYRRA